MMITLLLWACGPSLDSEDWHDVGDCEPIEDSRWRDECYAFLAPDVFRESEEAGEALLAAVSDPLIRDYVLLTVTREVAPGSPKYCRRIERKELRSRCDLIVRRPHLHRELLGLPEGAPPDTPARDAPSLDSPDAPQPPAVPGGGHK